MNIAVVGSDSRAIAIANMLLRAKHVVSLCDPLSHERATRAAQSLEGTTMIQSCDLDGIELIVLAIRSQDLDAVLTALKPQPGVVLVDTTRPAADGQAMSLAEIIAQREPSARVVKAMATREDVREAIPLASDDEAAKDLVRTVLESIGLHSVDLGRLSAARKIEQAAHRNDPITA